MTDYEKQIITELWEQKLGYRKISKIVGISENTVKSFCDRCNNPKRKTDTCKECGKPLKQTNI